MGVARNIMVMIGGHGGGKEGHGGKWRTMGVARNVMVVIGGPWWWQGMSWW